MTAWTWPAGRSVWRGRLSLALLLLVAVPMTAALAASKQRTGMDRDQAAMWRQRAQAKASQGPKGGRRLQQQALEPSSASMERQQLFAPSDTSAVPVKSLKVQASPAAPERDPAIEAIRFSLRAKWKVGGRNVSDPVVQGSSDAAFGIMSSSSNGDGDGDGDVNSDQAGPTAFHIQGGFEGISNGDGPGQGVYPPDANAAVGPEHLVQVVNEKWAVYNKLDGTPLYGPAYINALFAGMDSPCATLSNSDPLVLYDKWADRWVLSQATVAAPYTLCLAVSTSGDPLGTYHRWALELSPTTLYDNPRLSIWNDGYFVTFNRIDVAAFRGASVLALNRNDALAGGALRAQEFFTSPRQFMLMPADVDSWLRPDAGAPLPLISLGTTTSLELFHLTVDWAEAANSALDGPAALAVAPFSQLCSHAASCVPQPGTSVGLEGLGAFFMYRFAYRRFPNQDAAVISNAVSTGASAGIRWYELRNLTGKLTDVVVYQQGTYAPDETWRWMGTMAMDKVGNIALGYTTSSPTVYPSMAITGQDRTLPGVALDAMNMNEAVVRAGAGAQTGAESCWGDYASMSVDPTDECTLWFVHQYVAKTGPRSWGTFISSFRFPSCTTDPDAPPPNLMDDVAALSKASFAATASFSALELSGAPTPVPVPTAMPDPHPTWMSWSRGSLLRPERVYLGQNRFDNCLTGTTISLEGTGCCLPFGSEIYETNFYLFEPPSDGFYFFSTCNLADFDTIIAITPSEPYKGVLACNDDAEGCNYWTSKTDSIFLQGNMTYYVMIGGYDEWEWGSGVLTIGQTTEAPTPAPTPRWTGPTAQPTVAPTGPTPAPTNPPPAPGLTCKNAIPLALGDNPFVNMLTNETVDMTGTNCTFEWNPQQLFNVNWFTFTPTVNGSYQFSTCNMADFDTKIAVQNTCDPADGVIRCNDDNNHCYGATSRTTYMPLKENVKYWVLLGSYDNGTLPGSGTLRVNQRTSAPTRVPTTAPSKRPTKAPTGAPTSVTATTSAEPTALPVPPQQLQLDPVTEDPTTSPTPRPTSKPSPLPSRSPSGRPTTTPTKQPSQSPSGKPTTAPSKSPTARPTTHPTNAPSPRPTTQPSPRPTNPPPPTNAPSRPPTRSPTRSPTRLPTRPPTRTPTRSPTRRWWFT